MAQALGPDVLATDIPYCLVPQGLPGLRGCEPQRGALHGPGQHSALQCRRADRPGASTAEGPADLEPPLTLLPNKVDPTGNTILLKLRNDQPITAIDLV